MATEDRRRVWRAFRAAADWSAEMHSCCGNLIAHALRGGPDQMEAFRQELLLMAKRLKDFDALTDERSEEAP